MIVAMSVAAALASTGLAALNSALERQRLASATNELVTALHFARSEAVTRRMRVAVAANTPGDWAHGWKVFADANDNGTFDDNEVALRESTLPAQGTRITAHFGANYAGDVLSYDPTGVVRRPGNEGLVLGRISLSAGSETRTLCFASLRMRVVTSPRCS
ncbi:MAG TPA: GspH/FimT family pseudopilin [Burkholderiaceae bacterium]|nr:GspH/FimT family pseudopilin [Burkholderiaceae bacterium]